MRTTNTNTTTATAAQERPQIPPDSIEALERRLAIVRYLFLWFVIVQVLLLLWCMSFGPLYVDNKINSLLMFERDAEVRHELERLRPTAINTLFGIILSLIGIHVIAAWAAHRASRCLLVAHAILLTLLATLTFVRLFQDGHPVSVLLSAVNITHALLAFQLLGLIGKRAKLISKYPQPPNPDPENGQLPPPSYTATSLVNIPAPHEKNKI